MPDDWTEWLTEGDRLALTMYERQTHIAGEIDVASILRSLAASRALVTKQREQIISLLDITRVVHANHYGNPGFDQLAFGRNLRAEQALALTEAKMLERLG